jgi:hypothetical protein
MELTFGQVCKRLNQQPPRINYILETRPHIKPIKRVGILRIFDEAGVAAISAELEKIDSRKRVTATAAA